MGCGAKPHEPSLSYSIVDCIERFLEVALILIYKMGIITKTYKGLMRMILRTDLALESHEMNGEDCEGLTFEKHSECGLNIHRLNIRTASASQRLAKPIGNYVTIESLPLSENFRDVKEQIIIISKEILSMLPDKGTVLVIGIGNTEITSDALGPMSAQMVIATRHISGELAKSTGLSLLRPTAVISPGVLGQTGIETGEVVLSLLKSIKPAAVIAIDALASKSVSRLGTTIQISDSGISPGSGIGNNRLRLDKSSLGIPVIGIGIPTVVDAYTLVSDLTGTQADFDKGKQLMVTPKEIDLLTERGAKLIGMSINCALQQSYSFEDLTRLV